MTKLLIISGLLSFLELMLLYVLSPKKIKLTVVESSPAAIVYSNYFFLPFTTKIRRYKDIKEAYIRSRREIDKHGSYLVYDLVLKYSTKSVVLFRGERTEKDLLKHCEKINHYIASFEECIINVSQTKKLKIVAVYMLVSVPLILFAAALLGDTDPQYDMGYVYCFYGYLITTAITMVFILLSWVVNRYMDSLNTNSISIDDSDTYKKEQNSNIDSESKKIYNSVIK